MVCTEWWCLREASCQVYATLECSPGDPVSDACPSAVCDEQKRVLPPPGLVEPEMKKMETDQDLHIGVVVATNSTM